MFMVFPFFFFVFVMLLAVAQLVAIGLTIWALVEAARTPEPAFGPPWDNGKSAWTLGLALSFVIPFAVLVTPILWWTQGHRALRARAQIPRPFWSPRPAYWHPYPPQGRPPE